ncbi:hypothetical protein PGT21_011549 [Puccinia graminis f. sp. tritici]|uniref:Uncharacterized protein n=1 Tax=Puccinia graminis f. sp. tritici TaxID=56615 RepID=A0A5B0M350_PUCGR|nr:hypothetical protein PGT21_011549 [Puccinia graminis f. sp. tritici]
MLNSISLSLDAEKHNSPVVHAYDDALKDCVRMKARMFLLIPSLEAYSNNPHKDGTLSKLLTLYYLTLRPTWGFSQRKAQVMNLVGIFPTSHRENSRWLDTAHPTSGPCRRSSRGKLANVMSTEEVKPMTLPCVRPAWRACQRAPTTPGGQPDPTPPAVRQAIFLGGVAQVGST